MKQKILFFLVLIMFVSALTACGNNSSNDEVAGGYQIYYVNNDQTGVVTQGYKPEKNDKTSLIKEILDQLEKPVDSIDYLCAKPENVRLLDYSLEAETLKLKFSNQYNKMEKSTEVLMRMAYVKTLVQIAGVAGVEFYVEDEPLRDSNDKLIGAMNENSFVKNDGSEVNEYDTSEIVLYYASNDGRKLVKTTRKVTHSVNMSLEKVVMEQLIEGPSANSDLKSTIPDGTKLLSISTSDNVCYVNLNSRFMELVNDITAEVQVYSIVNSLVELPNINKVQITVYGDENNTLSNNLEIGSMMERNLDIISE